MSIVYFILDDEHEHSGIVQYLMEENSIDLNLYHWHETSDLWALAQALTKGRTRPQTQEISDTLTAIEKGVRVRHTREYDLITVPDLLIFDPVYSPGTAIQNWKQKEILEKFITHEVPTFMISPYYAYETDALPLKRHSLYESIKDLEFTTTFLRGYDQKEMIQEIKKITSFYE